MIPEAPGFDSVFAALTAAVERLESLSRPRDPSPSGVLGTDPYELLVSVA